MQTILNTGCIPNIAPVCCTIYNGPFLIVYSYQNFFNSFVQKGIIDDIKHVIKSPFTHLTYTEAVDILIKIYEYEKAGKKLFN